MDVAAARTVPLARLNESMPAALRPVESLRHALRDEASRLEWARISAFSRLPEGPDDLAAWIDDATQDALEGYRARFSLFLASLASSEKCYAYMRRSGPPGIAFACDEPMARRLGQALAESDDADLFVPGRGIALLGHDDFGCNLVYADRGGREWAEGLASAAGLYSVRPAR